MILSTSEKAVVALLCERGLISRRDVVHGRITIENSSRRHLSMKVYIEDGRSLFVKRAHTTDRQMSLAREASAYRMFSSLPEVDPLRRHVPVLVSYDSARHVLIVEVVERGENARERQLQHRRMALWCARGLGAVLSMLHASSRAAELGTHDRETVASDPPGALEMHRPHVSLIHQSSAASLELFAAIQSSDELCAQLNHLSSSWRRTSLIHGDVKWDNVVVAPPTMLRTVTLVDWEFFAMGDPCWDVGAVFADYLGIWLASIPMGGGRPFSRFESHARIPLARLRPSLRTFWQTYVNTAEELESGSDVTLDRCMQNSAARLLQSAFEYTQGRGLFDGRVVATVQLAKNVLDAPAAAARHLLDLP